MILLFKFFISVSNSDIFLFKLLISFFNFLFSSSNSKFLLNWLSYLFFISCKLSFVVFKSEINFWILFSKVCFSFKNLLVNSSSNFFNWLFNFSFKSSILFLFKLLRLLISFFNFSISFLKLSLSLFKFSISFFKSEFSLIKFNSFSFKFSFSFSNSFNLLFIKFISFDLSLWEEFKFSIWFL